MRELLISTDDRQYWWLYQNWVGVTKEWITVSVCVGGVNISGGYTDILLEFSSGNTQNGFLIFIA